MAGYQNNMSNILNKIERRLGMLPLTPHLPKEYNKDAWADVIVTDTLETFSRYYHRKIPFHVTKITAPRKNGWYYIDEDYLGNQKILGIGDIDWSNFSNDVVGQASQYGYGLTDVGISMSFEDILNYGMRATYSSMINNNIYPEFEYPNRLRICSVGNNSIDIGDFVINLFIKHSDDLSSISPTKMETFEALAQADIAGFLANNLKYWDGLETVLSSSDLKLGTLESEASKRDQVIDEIKQSYVSAGNESIPLWVVD